MTATSIGQFDIKHVLGSGGMGTVYAAVDTELGRWVAIKTLRPEIGNNPTMAERFRAEGISLARLNHTNITTLYGMPRERQEMCLVMELVNGQTLDAVLGRVARLGVPETLAIVCQTAAGLDYAHQMGVIHRDIKPSNLMLTSTGVVKIMDFGIARIRGTQRLTQAGTLGTYAYMAPEQFRRGEGTERSDLYSLACVVYEMLSGNIPFDAPTEPEMMRGHLEVPVRPLTEVVPGIDERISGAVQRALSKDPAQRFASVGEFSDAMGAAAFERTAASIIRERILARVPAPPRPTVQIETGSAAGARAHAPSSGAGGSVRAPSPKSSRAVPALALAGAIVAVAIGGGVFLWPGPDGNPPKVRIERSVAEAGSRVAGPQTLPVPPERTEPPAIAISPPSVGSPFVSPTPTTPSLPQFIPSPGVKPLAALTVAEVIGRGLAPSDLVSEALRRFATGQDEQVDDARELLEYTANTLHYPAAAVEMAKIYDPVQSNRPPGLQPDRLRAARYYSYAAKAGDTSAASERESFHQYLEQIAHGSGAEASEAKELLRRYW